MEKLRKRNWCLVLYPEDEKHVSAMEVLEKGGFKYAAILHDKDVWSEADAPDHVPGETKKAHWHVVLKFDQAVWNTSLAKQLGLSENYLQPCANLDGALLYLIHSENPEKYQYDAEAVFGPLVPALKRLLVAPDEGTRILTILDEIDSYTGGLDAESYKMFFRKMCSNGLYGEIRRAGNLIDRYIQAHNQTIYEELKYRKSCKLSAERFADDQNRATNRSNWVDRCDYLDRHGFPPKPLD